MNDSYNTLSRISSLHGKICIFLYTGKNYTSIRFWTIGIPLSPPVIYITDLFKAILLRRFLMFYVLVFKYFVLLACCEPLQKLRVRLGTCKTGLSPPVTLCY